MQVHGAIGGHLGYLPLVLPVLLAARRRHIRLYPLVIGVLLAALLWFITAQYLRYGLPLIALNCALGRVALAEVHQFTNSPRSRTALQVLLCVIAMAGVIARMQLPDISHRHAFGLQTQEGFLDEHLALQGAGSYAIMRQLDSDPTVTRVLALHDGARLYTRATISSVFTTGGDLNIEGDDALILQRLRSGGYSHILVDCRTWAGSLFGWDRVTVMNEEFLRRHTALVMGSDYSYLYRILTPEEGAQKPGRRDVNCSQTAASSPDRGRNRPVGRRLVLRATIVRAGRATEAKARRFLGRPTR
jgi:hypothetical protein